MLHDGKELVYTVLHGWGEKGYRVRDLRLQYVKGTLEKVLISNHKYETCYSAV